jgi:hypothetical protein
MEANTNCRSASAVLRVLVSLVALATPGLITYALQSRGMQEMQPVEGVTALQTDSTIADLPVNRINAANGTVVSVKQISLFESEQPNLMSAGLISLFALAPFNPTQATPTPSPAGAMVLLDTFTGQPTRNITTSIPRTYMGDGFIPATLPGGTSYVNVRSFTFYMTAAAVANYTDVHARLTLWNTYVQTGTAVPQFSNLAALFDVDLGPVNVTVPSALFEITVEPLSPYPFLAVTGAQWGYAQNFQSSTTGGPVVDDDNLTSVITSNASGAGAYPTGQITTFSSPNFGYYRNASGLTNFNFLGTDLRTLGLVSQAIGIILRGDPQTGPTPIVEPTPSLTPTPTPSPSATPTATPFPTPTPSAPPPTATATATPSPPPPVCLFPPTFGGGDFANTTTLVASGWVMRNNSSAPLGNSWFQGVTSAFTSQAGAANAYIAANFQSTNGTTGTETISNWLVLPPLSVSNSSHGNFVFWTRTVTELNFPDRLQVRLSTNGSSSNVGSSPTDVGDFTTVLLDINPTYVMGGYPTGWTQYFVQLPCLPSGTVRVAFRYFVENAGAFGINSNYIGIDSVAYDCHGTMCIPSQGTPTPTPSPTATPTASPTPATAAISGTATLCAAVSPVPLAGLTVTLTGSSGGSVTTDGAGGYQFVGLSMSGSYTVTPTKGDRAPGSNGITTVDVIAEQNHALNRVLLTGCRLLAAECAGTPGINTVDVLAIQSFALGRTAGIGNVGKYNFTPASRSYSPLGGDQTVQNYDAIVLGDVANPIANP